MTVDETGFRPEPEMRHLPTHTVCLCRRQVEAAGVAQVHVCSDARGHGMEHRCNCGAVWPSNFGVCAIPPEPLRIR